MVKGQIDYKTENSHFDDNEIDFITVLKMLLRNKKTIINTVLIFAIFGLFIAVFTPKEYTASTTLVPQSSELSVGGNLGGLAALAGFNIGGLSEGSGISPVLYPQIVNSIPFQKELLQIQLTIQNHETQVSLSEYYTNIYNPGLLSFIKKYTIGLPGLIIKKIKKKLITEEVKKDNEFLSITEDEELLLEVLNEQLNLNINDNDGFIVITMKMPEALAAAEFVEQTQRLLQNYLISFKIQKSKEHLLFIEQRYLEKENEFRSAQQRLASFRDHNRNVNSSLAQTKLERYQADYDLAFSIYSELAKQLEAQKLQVKKDTPIFTIISPANIPYESSKPKRLKIIFTWMFLGLILASTYIISVPYYKSFKQNF